MKKRTATNLLIVDLTGLKNIGRAHPEVYRYLYKRGLSKEAMGRLMKRTATTIESTLSDLGELKKEDKSPKETPEARKARLIAQAAVARAAKAKLLPPKKITIQATQDSLIEARVGALENRIQHVDQKMDRQTALLEELILRIPKLSTSSVTKREPVVAPETSVDAKQETDNVGNNTGN